MYVICPTKRGTINRDINKHSRAGCHRVSLSILRDELVLLYIVAVVSIATVSMIGFLIRRTLEPVNRSYPEYASITCTCLGLLPCFVEQTVALGEECRE